MKKILLNICHCDYMKDPIVYVIYMILENIKDLSSLL